MVEPIAGNDENLRDRRARISAKPGAKNIIYGPLEDPNNILKPLHKSGGLLFPYTPMINDSATVNYETYDPIHSNQPFAAFKSVAAKEIVIIGTFTTMNQQEAAQNLANIHFLRTVTKMYFGIKSRLRGTPPPILLFNAYGTAIFHNVPIIITNYNIELPMDVDYVNIKSDAGSEIRLRKGLSEEEVRRGTSPINVSTLTLNDIETVSGDITAWLPTRFTITINMQVQNTPDRLRREFDLDAFRTGALIKRGGWV